MSGRGVCDSRPKAEVVGTGTIEFSSDEIGYPPPKSFFNSG